MGIPIPSHSVSNMIMKTHSLDDLLPFPDTVNTTPIVNVALSKLLAGDER
jgi:hypothetical protein